MSFGGCKPGDPCWDLGYVFNDVLPPNIISGLNELYGCGINPYSFIDCNMLTGCTSVLSGLTGPYITGATYNSSTGCLTFYRQSGATFSACGFLTADTGYWIMNDSGDIYNTGTTASFVGIGTNVPAHQLHVEALPLADPLRVVKLNNRENYIVTVDADGIFYRSEYNSGIIDGGDF
jgi:hypothetical protein